MNVNTRWALIGGVWAGVVMWLIATAFYFISMTDYPYLNVVGGFTLLAAAVGAAIGCTVTE